MSMDKATDDIKIAHVAVSSDYFAIQFSPHGPLVDEGLDTTQLVLPHGSISDQVLPSYPAQAIKKYIRYNSSLFTHAS